jgi:WD40 repeat protein
MLTGSEDGSIRLWDVKSGEELRQFRGHTGRVECLALSPDERYVVSAASDYQGGEDNTVRLWDAESGEELRRITGQLLYTRDLLFSHDGRHVYTAGVNAILQCDIETGQPVHRFPRFPTVPLSLALSPDGRLLAAGYAAEAIKDGHWADPDNCLIRLWDLSSRTLVREFRGHTGPVVDLAFTADGQRLLSVSDGEHDAAGKFIPSGDLLIRLWDVNAGRELARFQPHERVRGLATDPKGAWFLSGGESLRLWRLSE